MGDVNDQFPSALLNNAHIDVLDGCSHVASYTQSKTFPLVPGQLVGPDSVDVDFVVSTVLPPKH